MFIAEIAGLAIMSTMSVCPVTFHSITRPYSAHRDLAHAQRVDLKQGVIRTYDARLEGLASKLGSESLGDDAARELAKEGVWAIPYVVWPFRTRETKAYQRAITALATMGEPAIGPLITLLSDDRVGWGASQALARIGKPAVGPLICLLSTGDRLGRSSAMNALGLIKDPRAIKPLVRALSDQERVSAAIALGRIGEPAVDELIDVLITGGLDEIGVAAGLLGQIKSLRAVDPLIAILSDDRYYVRWMAARALGKIGARRALGPLRNLLVDRDETVRRAAGEAIEIIG